LLKITKQKIFSIEDEDMISPEGMERFCNDLEVAPDNVRSIKNK